MDKFDLIVDRIEEFKDHMVSRLKSIDDNLAEHMQRTDILEQLHKDNQKHTENLEKPLEFLGALKKIVVYVAALAGGIMVILKLLGGFNV